MDNYLFIEINQSCLIKEHEKSNIEFYCGTCNDIPMCKECIPLHEGHSIKLYDDNKKKSIIDNFKSSVDEYKNESEFLKKELKELEGLLKISKNNSIEKKKIIKDTFQKLHKILQVEESNLMKQIDTIDEENNNQFTFKRSIAENKIEILENTINKFDNNNNKIELLNNQQLLNLDNQFIELNKFNYKINEINKELPPFYFIIQPFKYVEIKIIKEGEKFEDLIKNEEPLSEIEFIFKDFTKNYFSIYSISKINDYYIVLDKDLPQSTYHDFKNYAISNEGRTSSIIPKCNELLCTDIKSFDNRTNIYDKVNSLYLINIKDQIKVGSIPSTKELYIYNYQHSLFKNIIPNGVESLYLFNIQKPLHIGTIPSSVKNLYIKDGFKHKIVIDLIPNTVRLLELCNIEQPLDIGSIPSTINTLKIHDGFKHKLSKGIIPVGVEVLILYNINQPLEIGSLPSSIKTLTLEENFKHQLSKDIIPEGVTSIYIYSNLFNLKDFTIPKSVKEIHILNENIEINFEIIDRFSNLNVIYLIEKLYDSLDVKNVKSDNNIYIKKTFK